MSIIGFACLFAIIADTGSSGVLENMGNCQFTMEDVRKHINSECSLSLPAKSFSSQQYKATYAGIPVVHGAKVRIPFTANFKSAVLLGSDPSQRQSHTSAVIKGQLEISEPVFFQNKAAFLAHQKTQEELKKPTKLEEDLVNALEPHKKTIILKIRGTGRVGTERSIYPEVEDVQLTKIYAFVTEAYAEYSCGSNYFYVHYSINLMLGADLQVDVTCPK